MDISDILAITEQTDRILIIQSQQYNASSTATIKTRAHRVYRDAINLSSINVHRLHKDALTPLFQIYFVRLFQ
jgi:hypothetical protein